MNMALFMTTLGSLLAIVNPFAVLPMFLTLTDSMAERDRKLVAVRAGLASLGTAVVIAIGGVYILDFFGIQLPAFQVASGVVLLLIALDLLRGNVNVAHDGSPQEQRHQQQVSQVAFYPLTFPVIVGPGTIAAIILYTSQATDVASYIGVAAAVTGMILTVTAVLWFAGSIGRFMSVTLRTVVTRITGVLLISISVSLMSSGLLELFPGLAGSAA